MNQAQYDASSLVPFSAVETQRRSWPRLVPRTRRLDARVELVAAEESRLYPLAALWQDLLSGGWSVAEAFFAGDRCYVALASLAERRPALTARQVEIVEAVLSGSLQKSLAFELNVSSSTIAMSARAALTRLGLDCKPSRAHPLLMRAAKAACDEDFDVLGSMSTRGGPGAMVRVVSIRRPDCYLEGLLAPAELQIARGLIEGYSHRDIACQRGRSARTVANQVASLFRRLRVSTRNDLVHRSFAAAPHVDPSRAEHLLPCTPAA